MEEFKQLLNEFWLLDTSEYSIIKSMINENIEQLENKLAKGEYEEDRQYYSDQHLKDFYIIMREKIDYIISNGLCKIK